MCALDNLADVVNQRAMEAVQQSLLVSSESCYTAPAYDFAPKYEQQSSDFESSLGSCEDGIPFEGEWHNICEFLDNDIDFDMGSFGKRRPDDIAFSDFDLDEHGAKRPKLESDNLGFSDFDSIYYPDLAIKTEPGVPEISDSAGQSSDSYRSANFANPVMRESSVDSIVSEDSVCDDTAEFHFEQIRLHCKLAAECLKRGQYEKTKNIITWAHDLKNKHANEVKKAAEKAWEADKDKESACALRQIPRKPVIGSTKRVEQFRKNLRRWMTGTHTHGIGVEWMVFARMEHLQAIAAFILGDSLPNDPASPTAVAESISKHLGHAISQQFVEQELAEPEPGKRYTIGPGLVPYLNSRQQRNVPTLAFTMPSDTDQAALQSWVTSLKELFPNKPAPKPKAAKV